MKPQRTMICQKSDRVQEHFEAEMKGKVANTEKETEKIALNKM